MVRLAIHDCTRNSTSLERITIKNRDELEAIILAQDGARQQACATFIASRAALRGAPPAIQFF